MEDKATNLSCLFSFVSTQKHKHPRKKNRKMCFILWEIAGCFQRIDTQFVTKFIVIAAGSA